MNSPASEIDTMIERLAKLPPKELDNLKKNTKQAITGRRLKWTPNPGPQTDAYLSKAHTILFGGEPGGGKSQLGLGLSFNDHCRSLIMRRYYTDLSGLIADALKINGTRDGFNGSPPPMLRINDAKHIDFGACARLGDEQHWMGRAHDLIVADEATQFLEVQIRFLMGWLRHEDPKRRCRVLMPTNPPLTAEGEWFIKMFAPWLDDKYPYPAKHGELRYVVTDERGKDIWVNGPQDGRMVEVAGQKRLLQPTSRSFIFSSVSDNPFYAAGSYRAKLDAMVEPHRSILLGKFKTTFKDQPNQVIPTAWIKEAQARWTPDPPVGV